MPGVKYREATVEAISNGRASLRADTGELVDINAGDLRVGDAVAMFPDGRVCLLVDGTLKVWTGSLGFLETADGDVFISGDRMRRSGLQPHVGRRLRAAVERRDGQWRARYIVAHDADQVECGRLFG